MKQSCNYEEKQAIRRTAIPPPRQRSAVVTKRIAAVERSYPADTPDMAICGTARAILVLLFTTSEPVTTPTVPGATV